MIRRLISGLVVVALALAIGAHARRKRTSAERGADYLRTAGEDGGFRTGSRLSDPARRPMRSRRGGGRGCCGARGGRRSTPPMRWALIEAGVADENAGQLAKVITALSPPGKTNRFQRARLVSDPLALQGEEGTFGMGAFDHRLMRSLQNA